MTTSKTKEMGMANNAVAAAILVRRTFEQGDVDQYKRELVQNSVEAGATNIEAGAIRIKEYGEAGGIKAAFIDNGEGMDSVKLPDHLCELFNGKSDMSLGNNFQFGARVATLPISPHGVIVASWVDGDPEGSMITLEWNDEDGVYQSVANNDAEGEDDRVGVPPAYMKHPMIEKAGHGTVVILLGTDEACHTVGKVRAQDDGTYKWSDTRSQRDDWQYYNAKWIALPEHVKRLAFMWFAGVKGKGISNLKDKIAPGEYYTTDSALGTTFRTYAGLDFIFSGKTQKAGIKSPVVASGTQQVTSKRGYKAEVRWTLFEDNTETGRMSRTNAKGGGSSEDDEGLNLGLFGEVHNGEVYNLSYDKRNTRNVTSMLERYGIVREAARKRIAVLVKPEPKSKSFVGAVPTPARNALLITNAALPHHEWGEDFALHLPQELRELMHLDDDAKSKSLDEKIERSRKHIAGVFTRKRRVKSGDEALGPLGKEAGESGQTDDGTNTEGVTWPGVGGTTAGSKKSPPAKPHIGGGTKKRINTGERNRAVGVQPIKPCWDSLGEEFGDGYDGKLVKWIPSARTFHVNGSSPYLQEMIKNEQLLRPASRRDEVAGLVQDVILGHIASQILAVETYSLSGMTGVDTRSKAWADNTANTDDALTASLLNVETVEQMVRNTFRGRTGFGMVEKTTEKDAA